jgi:hypothetical protein
MENETTKEHVWNDSSLDFIFKISFTFAVFIAVGVLIMTFIVFSNNQVTFNNGFTKIFNELSLLENTAISDGVNYYIYSFVKKPITPSSADFIIFSPASKDKMVELRMEYLKKLSEMHKQASVNDLIVFMNSFLSAVLVGLGTYMLNRTRQQKEEFENKYVVFKGEVNDKYSGLREKVEFENSELDSKNISNILLSFITPKLSEAIISIFSYKDEIVPDNKNLTDFTSNIKKISDECESIDFSKADKSLVDNFIKQFNTAKEFYSDAAKRDKDKTIINGIDELHKLIVYRYYRIIEDKLKDFT